MRDFSSPVELGFLPLPNGALEVVSDGSIAWVGYGSVLSGEHGLAAVDVSDPADPALVGTLRTDKPVHGIALSGSRGVVATGFPLSGSVLVADLSVPSSPLLLGQDLIGDAAMDVVVSGDTAWVAARSLGLHVTDVGDPASPACLDALPTGRETWALARSGDLALLAERSSSGPAAVTAMRAESSPVSLELLGSSLQAEATGVALGSGAAFLLRRDELQVHDTSDPSEPVPLASWTRPEADFHAVAHWGDLVAVADGSVVDLLDVTDPTSPTRVGGLVLEDGAVVRLVLRDGVLFVVNGRGLEIFDVGMPSSPSRLATLDVAGWASDLALAGDDGFLVAGDTLHVLDLFAPSSPSVRATLTLPDTLACVAVEGGLAAVGGLAELHLLDVSSPSSPAVIGTLPGGPTFDVVLEKDRALLAGGADGVLVVDVSDPALPSVEAFHDTSGVAVALEVADDVVHLATLDAQHWLLGCDTCPGADCSVDAVVVASETVVCEGTAVTLDGSDSSSTGCDSGSLEWQWLEDGVPIPGADGPSFVVSGDHATGTFTFGLEATCAADPSCVATDSVDVTILPDTFPVIDPLSLRVRKEGPEPGHRLSWLVESGSGETNVHLSTEPWRLLRSGPDPTTIVAVEPGTEHLSSYDPPEGAVAHYRVFGRRSCTGESAALAP